MDKLTNAAYDTGFVVGLFTGIVITLAIVAAHYYF